MRSRFATALLLVVVLCAASAAFAEHDSKAAVKITNGPVIESVFDDHAVIAWSTNQKSSTTLMYGTDRNSLNEKVQAPWGGSPHRVTVKYLQPSTTYYFRVQDRNAEHNGTGLQSEVYSFTTVAKGAQPDRANKNVGVQGENESASSSTSAGSSTASSTLPQSDQSANGAVQITNGPVIEGMWPDHTVIAWSTSSPASTTVMYGTDRNNLTQQAQAPWGGSPHRATLSGLQPNTTYYFRVQSQNAKGSGTGLQSEVYSFKTLAAGAAPDTSVHNVGVVEKH